MQTPSLLISFAILCICLFIAFPLHCYLLTRLSSDPSFCNSFLRHSGLPSASLSSNLSDRKSTSLAFRQCCSMQMPSFFQKLYDSWFPHTSLNTSIWWVRVVPGLTLTFLPGFTSQFSYTGSFFPAKSKALWLDSLPTLGWCHSLDSTVAPSNPNQL